MEQQRQFETKLSESTKLDQELRSEREEIHEIIFSTDEDTKKQISYGLFFPTEMKRSITKGQRFVLLRISYMPQQKIIATLPFIFAELNDKINKLDEKIKSDEKYKWIVEAITKIQELIAELKKKELDSKESYSLSREIFAKVIVILDGQKDLPEDIDKTRLELQLWLEGLCLKLTVNARRKEINAEVLSEEINKLIGINEKNNESLYLLNKNNEIKNEVIKLLSKFKTIHPKETVLILLAVLESFREKVVDKKEFCETKEAIDYAIDHFDEMHTEYYSNEIEVLARLEKRGKKKIFEDLHEFELKIALLQPTNETRPFIQELSILFQLLYLYPHCNRDLVADTTLRLKLSTTRKGLTKCYLDAAECSVKKINEFDKTLKQTKPQPVTLITNETKKTKEIVKETSEISKETVKEVPKIPPKTLSAMSNLTEAIENLKKEEPIKKIEDDAKINEPDNDDAPEDVEPVNELEFWKIIKEAKDSDDEIKIIALRNAIQSFNLSENQKKRYDHVNEKLKPLMVNYIKNTWMHSLFGVFANYLPDIPRKSAPAVQLTLDKLEKTTDPKKCLQFAYVLRLVLTNNKSKHLIKQIDEFLLEIYKISLNAKPPREKKEKPKGQTKKHANSLKIFKKISEPTAITPTTPTVENTEQKSGLVQKRQ